MRARPAILLLGSLVLCGAGSDVRFERLTRQLREAKDPRLRAQAALLLAAAPEPRIAEPLCAALDDTESLVRLAAAKGLVKLAEPTTRECLEKHRADSDAAVHEELEVGVVLLGGTPEHAKLYISLPEIKAASPEVGGDLLKVAEGEVREKLARMGAMFAPPMEPKAAAAKVLKDRKLKGFLVSVNLEGQGDTVTMRLLCATYPENKMLGQVSIKGKEASKEEIVRGIAPALLDDAAQEFGWSSP